MKKRIVMAALMLFTLGSANAQGLPGFLGGLFQKGASNPATNGAQKEEAGGPGKEGAQTEAAREAAQAPAQVAAKEEKPKIEISPSTTPYDFKGDPLGMRFDAFMKVHHEPGMWSLISDCTNGTCSLKKSWVSSMNCKDAGPKLKVCGDQTKILDNINATTSYFFADDTLISIRVSFSYQIPVLLALREAITQKLGPMAYESTDRAFGILDHWENATSIAEMYEHNCVLSANNSTVHYLLGWKREIEMALNRERCVWGAPLDYHYSHVTYIYKEKVVEAFKAIEERDAESRKKALSNL